MRQFPVIPGNIHVAVNPELQSIHDRVVGLLPYAPNFPELGPAVATQTVSTTTGKDIGDVDICPISVFWKLYLPAGEKLAATTALALYNGGRA